MREFDFIRLFAGLAAPGGLDLLDDAAVFSPPPGRELVVCADAIVQGVHFLDDDPPDLVARKLLRVNLSDLAAMAATPLHYLLSVCVPGGTDQAWFAAFAAGLAVDQAAFGITLLGGDTTSTPGPVTLSATVIGHVAPGCALRRGGAGVGDDIWVTGTVGDGALGLLALRDGLADPDGILADRYRLPRPRLGLALAGVASAGMDVSDGLLQDCGHMARACGAQAEIELGLVPLSAAARAALMEEAGALERRRLEVCLTGGDDYELLLAAAPARAGALRAVCAQAGVPLARIGRLVAGAAGCVLLDGGREVAFGRQGWSHF